MGLERAAERAGQKPGASGMSARGAEPREGAGPRPAQETSELQAGTVPESERSFPVKARSAVGRQEEARREHVVEKYQMDQEW